MKKILTIICLLITISLFGCGTSNESIVDEAIKQLESNIKDEVTSDFELAINVAIGDKLVKVEWTSDNEAITHEGKVTRTSEDVMVNLKAVLSYNDVTKVKDFKVVVLKEENNYDLIISEALKTINLPLETKENIPFPREVVVEDKKLSVSYESSNEDVISNEGIVSQTNEDIDVEVKLIFIVEEYQKIVTQTIKVLKTEKDAKKILEEAYNQISIPSLLTSTYILPQEITVGNEVINVEYKSDNEVLEGNVIVMPEEEDVVFDFAITLLLGEEKLEKQINNISIKSFKSVVTETIAELNIPSSTNKNLVLVDKKGDISFQWSTSNKYVLTNQGVINFVEKDTDITLSLMCVLEDDYVMYFYSDFFEITVKPYDALDRIEKVYDKISLPTSTQNNLSLVNEYDYDVIGEWESSNPEVISNTGFVIPQKCDTKVTLSLKLKYENEEKEYTFDVLVTKVDMTGCDEYYGKHNLVDRAAALDITKMDNLEYKDGKVVLKEDALEGTYTSKIFKVRNFTSVVGSYSCITDTKATAELEIRVRVNGVWSKYFSYGKYGLGLTNIYYDDSDSIAELSTDEIFVLNDKEADAVQYKFTMRKTSMEANSPQLSLVSLALNISNYVYPVDTTNLPSEKDIDVPKLYQHDVPSIGSVICSATTTTMLLKWKGFDFTDKGYTYEHEFMAKMVADTGHNNPTYGNWSYNMITAGAFGVNAYVARMYSWEEVKWHLNNVGPLGANVRGQFGSYSTNGHLIVIRGYKETATGTIVICNDPNIKGVYYEVTLTTFMNCWKKIAYIVE